MTLAYEGDRADRKGQAGPAPKARRRACTVFLANVMVEFIVGIAVERPRGFQSQGAFAQIEFSRRPLTEPNGAWSLAGQSEVEPRSARLPGSTASAALRTASAAG